MQGFPFSASEQRFLEVLLGRRVRFLVVGLSAAAIQGAPVVTQDIDLWFEDLRAPEFRAALAETGATFIPSEGEHPPMLVGGGAQLFDLVLTMHGLRSFDEEFAGALRIAFGSGELSVLPLDRVIASKRALNRPRDRLVLPVLEDTLRSTQQ